MSARIHHRFASISKTHRKLQRAANSACRAAIESLEIRRLLSFTAALVGNVVTFTGNGASDTLDLDVQGGFLHHNRQSSGDAGFASDFDMDSTVAGEQKLAANAPGAAVNVNADGNDDTLEITGLPGLLDNLRYVPSAVGAGTVINDSEPVPNVNFTGVEHLNLIIQQADGDGVRVDGTAGNDQIEFLPGVTSDKGEFVGTMDQNNATGSGPFTMTPMSYSGASPLANDGDVNFFNPGGTDSLVYNGTLEDDNITIHSGEAGGTEFRNTINGIVMSRLEVFNISSALVRGLAGSNTITTNLPAGPAGVALTIQGGGSDTLNYVAPGGAAATIDYGLSSITSTGGNTVTFSGLAKINETSSSGAALTIKGTAGADDFTYTPSGASAGSVSLAGAQAVTDFSGVGGAFTIDALAGSDSVTVDGTDGNDIINASRSGANTLVQVGATKTLTLPSANTESLVIAGGLGDDQLNVNVGAAIGSDVIPVPILFDGGDGHDLIDVFGTPTTPVDEVIYSPGPASGQGRLRYEDAANAQLMQIDFANVEPAIDLVTANIMTVNGTDADNSISYTGPQLIGAGGRVAIDSLESIEFANKKNLAINSLGGSDQISLNNPKTPPGLTGTVTVNGGDPTASDTLIVNGIAGVLDNLRYIPSAVGAGTVVNDSEPQPNVVFNHIEHLTTVIQQADGDGVRVDGTAGNDQVEFLPGVTSDSGTFVGTMDQNNATGSGPFTMTPMTFSGASPLANDGDVNFFNPGGTDSLVYNGTVNDDNMRVAPGEAGGTEFRNTLNGIVMSRLEVFNIASALVRGLAGNNTITTNVPAGSAAVALTVQGGGSDTLNYFAPSGAATTIDYGLSQITSATPAGNPITFSGIATINEASDGAGSSLTINGVAGPENIIYTPAAAHVGTIAEIGQPTVNFSGIGSTLTIDPKGGTNSVTINGTPVNDTITATGNGAGNNVSVQVGALQAVVVNALHTGMIDINGGTGDDALAVDSTAGAFVVPITYDGGPGSANSLSLFGGTATSDSYFPGPLPGEGFDVLVINGATESVQFQNLAPILDTVAGPLAVSAPAGNAAITYAQPENPTVGEVSVNNHEPIFFTNKTVLDIVASIGTNTITLNNNGTPAGLTEIDVSGGNGLDTIIDNAFFTPVTTSSVGTPGVLNLSGQPQVNYSNVEYVNVINALDTIAVTPVVINGIEGQLLNNISVGTFTGGAAWAVAGDFNATIDWGDGTTSAGAVSGSAGDFSVSGSHTYAEEGVYSPIVTVTDPKVVANNLLNNVFVTVNYIAPLSSPINDSSNISDADVVATAVTSPVVTMAAGGNTGTIKVATFKDPGGAEPLADYSASIDWGDGNTTSGAIALSGGVFTVTAKHTYAAPSTYSPIVTISHDTSTPQVVTDTNRVVVVSPSGISASGVAFAGKEGRVASGTVAKFTVANGALNASAFSATINWGDGSASTSGTVVKDSAGHFHVTGSHAYAEEITYAIKVTIKEVGGNTATATSTATISPSPLDQLAGKTVTVPLGEANLVNLTVGTFRDQDSLEKDAKTFTGTINWGDGKTSTATFVFSGSTFNVGSFWKIQGSHKYTAKNTYTVKITFHDVGGPFVNSVITSTIKVV